MCLMRRAIHSEQRRLTMKDDTAEILAALEAAYDEPTYYGEA